MSRLGEWWHDLWHEHILLAHGEGGEYIGICRRRVVTYPVMVVYEPGVTGMLTEYYPIENEDQLDDVTNTLTERWRSGKQVREVEEREGPEGGSS